MTHSMTGYGSATLEKTAWNLNWEIKSVNSRHLDIKWKIPPSLFYTQSGWEKMLRQYARRGRVEIYLGMRILDPDILGLEFDHAQAGAMLEKLKNFASSSGYAFEPDLNVLLRMQSMWQEKSSSMDEHLLSDLETCLENALQDWNASRKTEGLQLTKDLQKRIMKLDATLLQLEGLAADNTHQRFQDLRARVEKLLAEMDVGADENRLLQELALMADRLDVSEELTRLKAHLHFMREALGKNGELGRRLDFFLQEAFREINTCANKCQNTQMSKIAVDFKSELEKCREQAQNLE
ncbi:YicC/YloC family endoribonuclease [Desulfonatronospira sp.]|uniref:YicC/YloC family endoribonuclease n=1 Tax=Desulfonatronospira sp. TaxID=1962951 RepID=UPI0025BEE022|nr:YicC/YloC family endoribonuclease [Desulfonatronospira sp.]